MSIPIGLLDLIGRSVALDLPPSAAGLAPDHRAALADVLQGALGAAAALRLGALLAAPGFSGLDDSVQRAVLASIRTEPPSTRGRPRAPALQRLVRATWVFDQVTALHRRLRRPRVPAPAFG